MSAYERITMSLREVDRLKVIQRSNFTGGVTSQRQRQFVFFDAAAVIANAD